ncbi:MAG TPA: zf-HC2 domain-containing protein [Candidatus Angelobacter sp.]|nr:zf-HC2 domain-containing protein [Candidatus Angelobacter sp.]
MIDHQDAVKNLMAERYLLGELNAGEREAYEEHLFSCDACFEQVKAGTEFVSHLRRIGTEEPRPALAPGFMARVMSTLRQPAALIFGLFLCASGIAAHQNAVISRLKEPRPELRSTLTGVAHGSGPLNSIEITRNSGLSLNVEYVRKGEFVSYQAQLLSDSGKVMHTIALPEKQLGTMASIAMPAEALEPGQYAVVVLGRRSDGTLEETGRGAFELRFIDN